MIGKLTASCRRALRSDACAIDRLGVSAFAGQWRAGSAANLLATRGVYGFSSVDRLDLVGYLFVLSTEDHVDIVSLAVDKGFRRLGVASALLDYMVEILMPPKIFLEVDTSNAAAESLYRKHRFTVLSTRKRYYASGADALVMCWTRQQTRPDR